MKLSRNQGIAIAVIAALVGWGIYHSKHRHYTPKTADEFFKRNPHLTRPLTRMELPADKLREGDKFQDGDYQLLANTVYPIDFYQTTKITQADQAPKDVESKGKLQLKSLGLNKGRLVILAEFQFEKSNEMKKWSAGTLEEFGILSDSKKKPTQEQILARSVLIKLEPTGRIREMYVASPKITRLSLGAKIKLLDEIFKQVAATKAGKVTKMEIDNVGYPYKMDYDIQDVGQNLHITASTTQDYGLNDTESKAAASGAQGMGMMAIRGKQIANIDWTWSKSEQRPFTQNSQGETELSIVGKPIAQAAGVTKINWGAAEKDSGIMAIASKLNNPINVDLLRAILRTQEHKTLKGAAAKPAVATKGKKQEKLTPEQAHDKAFQEMTDAIKENPSQIDSFKGMAMNASPGSEQMSMSLGALGYEGSAASQRALVEVYGRSDLTDKDRQKVLMELTLVDQALTPEAKKFLKAEFEKTDYAQSRTAKQAGLALGSSIAKDGDPDTIQFIHDKWDNVGSTAKDEADKRGRQNYLLKVMGNSKSDVFLSEANSMSGSSDAMLRGAAADSVRFSQSDDSRSLLFGLLNDKNAEVRTMVVQALRYQPFDDKTKNALMGCTGDTDVGVKLNCYRGLTYNMNQPGIKEFLSGKAGSETDPQVKRTLTEALSSEGSSQR